MARRARTFKPMAEMPPDFSDDWLMGDLSFSAGLPRLGVRRRFCFSSSMFSDVLREVIVGSMGAVAFEEIIRAVM